MLGLEYVKLECEPFLCLRDFDSFYQTTMASPINTTGDPSIRFLEELKEWKTWFNLFIFWNQN